jgi:hypothetical protein
LRGHRYDAIRQRCLNKSHPSYANYRQTGISCEFTNREEFIRYLLQIVAEKHPEIKTPYALADYEIKRIRSNGHFQPGNLRLVGRKRRMPFA